MNRAALLILLFLSLSGTQPPPPEFDLVVYGGTSAGVIAAVQAKRLGKSVVIVGPDKHLGGLSSGGLGFTDTGNKAVIGGLSREFYQRVWRYYDRPESWNSSFASPHDCIRSWTSFGTRGSLAMKYSQPF